MTKHFYFREIAHWSSRAFLRLDEEGGNHWTDQTGEFFGTHLKVKTFGE